MQRYIQALRAPGPARLSAIAAIFDVAQRQTTLLADGNVHDAVLTCLTIGNDPQAVALAIERLVQLGQSMGGHRDTMNVLLTAFSLLPASETAIALAEAYVTVYFEMSERNNNFVAEFAAFSDISRWKSHPLIRLLLASPSLGTLVSTAVCRGMVRFGLKQGPNFTNWFRRLVWPFTTYVFLHNDGDAATSLVLLDGLARIGSVGGMSASSTVLLHLCKTILPSLPLFTAQSQVIAASVAQTLVDLHHDVDAKTVESTIVHSLIVTAEQIVECHGSPRPFLNAAHVIVRRAFAESQPKACALQMHHVLPILSSIASRCAAEDAIASLTLYKAIVSHESCVSLPWVTLAPGHALTIVWLLPIVSFGHHTTVKSLAMSILCTSVAALRDGGVDKKRAGAEHRVPGDQHPPVISQAQWAHIQVTRLHSSRTYDCFLMDELLSAHVMLAGLMMEATREQMMDEDDYYRPVTASGAGTASRKHSKFHMVLISNLASLFASRGTKLAAYVISMIPVVLQIVATSVACGNIPLALNVLYDLLPILSRAAVPSAVPYIVHALNHTFFSSTGFENLENENLRALGLRLLCRTWVESRSSKAYAALADAMAGHVNDGTRPQMESAYAACLVDIAVYGGGKAADYATAIVDCLGPGPGPDHQRMATHHLPPPSPFIMAAGLGAIASLCESDVLDYVKAWKVVQARVPCLPAHPAPAVQWLRLLSCGIKSRDEGLDEETVHGIIQAVWSRCDSESGTGVEVRTQARRILVTALREHDDLASVFFEAHDPIQVAALLTAEPDAKCFPECEALAALACTYEQKEQKERKSQETSAGGKRPQTHLQGLGRLAATVPTTLLRPYAASGPDRDEVPLAAILSLWSSRDSDAFQRAFLDACSLPSTRLLPGFATPEGSPPAVVLASWIRFIQRWLTTENSASPLHHHRHVLETILCHVNSSSSSPWAIAALVRCSQITSSSIREVVTDALNVLYSRATCSSEGNLGQGWWSAVGATLGSVAEVLGKDASAQRLESLVEVVTEKKDLHAFVGLGLAAKDIGETSPWSPVPMDGVLTGLKGALDSLDFLDSLDSLDSGLQSGGHLDAPSCSLLNTVAYAAADALRGVSSRVGGQIPAHVQNEVKVLQERVASVLRVANSRRRLSAWRGAAGGLFDFYQAAGTLLWTKSELVQEIEDLLLPVVEQSEDGVVGGAAASALGCLFHSLVESFLGHEEPSSAASKEKGTEMISELTYRCIEATKTLMEHRATQVRSRAAAKIGAASGLSSLLLVLPRLDATGSQNTESKDLQPNVKKDHHVSGQRDKQKIIAVLTDAATSDPDPHVRWGVAWPLSWSCWRVRENITKSEKPLNTGAYSLLVDALAKTSVDHFRSIQDSLRAAALLRTLAAIPRIYKLADENGWSGVCRRLCDSEARSKNIESEKSWTSVTEVVRNACVMLAATHAAGTYGAQKDLCEFLLCDVFRRDSSILNTLIFKAPLLELETVVPRAIAALAEGDARSALAELVSIAAAAATTSSSSRQMEVKSNIVRALRAVVLEDGRASVVETVVDVVLLELMDSLKQTMISCAGMIAGLRTFKVKSPTNIENDSSSKFWENVAEFVSAIIESRGWDWVEAREKAFLARPHSLWTFIRAAASFSGLVPATIDVLQVPRAWLFNIGNGDDPNPPDGGGCRETELMVSLMGVTCRGHRLSWLVDWVTSAMLHAEKGNVQVVVRLVASSLTEGEGLESLYNLPMALAVLISSSSGDLSFDGKIVLIQKLLEALILAGEDTDDLVVACWSALRSKIPQPISSDSHNFQLQWGHQLQLWAKTARARQV